MADTYEEIKGIIVNLLGVDASKVTPEARFREELEADSLDLVELIMAFASSSWHLKRNSAPRSRTKTPRRSRRSAAQ